jgi:hypothetical protein
VSEKRATQAHRTAELVRTATVYNGDNWGLTLGDLRKLITAAEGVPDDAEVTLDRDGLQAHYSKIDTVTTKRITVTSIIKAEPT